MLRSKAMPALLNPRAQLAALHNCMMKGYRFNRFAKLPWYLIDIALFMGWDFVDHVSARIEYITTVNFDFHALRSH